MGDGQILCRRPAPKFPRRAPDRKMLRTGDGRFRDFPDNRVVIDLNAHDVGGLSAFDCEFTAAANALYGR